MPRDFHRRAVYSAEDALARQLNRGGSLEFFGSTLTLPIERRFADVASMQRFVDAVLDRIEAGLPGIVVRERAGASKAHYEHPRADRPAVIAVPLQLIDGTRWAARESVLLHEIAHHVTFHDERSRFEAAHGPTFCGHLIALHEAFIGPESALLLRASFDSAGVPVAPPTPAPTTPCSATTLGCHRGTQPLDGNPKSSKSGVVGA